VSTLKEQVDEAVAEVASSWKQTAWPSISSDVPDPAAMGYQDAKLVDATYLYSDIIDSSGLVRAAASRQEVASVMSAFLKVAVRILRAHDGHIRSFDGDRVMAVFAGARRQTRAVHAAMGIEYAVGELLDPKVQSTFASLRAARWHLRSMTGIASSEALLVRAGIRNNSDLLSVGAGPNLAAKLSDIRDGSQRRIAVGGGTYQDLERSAIQSGAENMWVRPLSISMGGASYSYYVTSYRWTSL
jgi:class 3 adenylate cyclase